jgi:hypothetical protein
MRREEGGWVSPLNYLCGVFRGFLNRALKIDHNIYLVGQGPCFLFLFLFPRAFACSKNC